MKKKVLILTSIFLFGLSLTSCEITIKTNGNNTNTEDKNNDKTNDNTNIDTKDDNNEKTEEENKTPELTKPVYSNKILDKDGNLLLELTNTYYSPISCNLDTKDNFKKTLHALLEQSHTKHLSYTPGCWDALKKADEDPNNSNNIKCFYSNKSISKNDKDGSSSASVVWNREHLYPQSKGFKSNDAIAHNDIHHLRATEKTINGKRGSDNFTDSGLKALCGEAIANSIKGDIARAVLYMTVRYETDDYTSYTYDGKTYTDSDDLDLELSSSTGTNTKPYTGSYYLGDLANLIKWNYEDPVDEAEKKRNEVVFGIQGNRNPFIDYNEFVAYLYPEYAKDYTDISNIEYLL